MTNYRNGPTTDHNGVVLVRVAHFGMSYGISEPVDKLQWTATKVPIATTTLRL